MIRERVRFTFYCLPCCTKSLCWVNPHAPNYCPYCGTFVYAKVKDGQFTFELDEGAMLHYSEGFQKTQPSFGIPFPDGDTR